MTSLVLIPCENGHPINGTLSALAAAQTIGPIIVLACGNGAERAAAKLSLMPKAERVLTFETEEVPRAETMAPLVLQQRLRRGCTHVVCVANAWARNVLPRAAALADVMALTDVVKIVDEKTYVRPVHAGSALMTLRLDEPVQFISVRSSAFEPPHASNSSAAPVESINEGAATAANDLRTALLLTRSHPEQDGNVELIGARIVVSGGRGTGSAEGYDQLRPLARMLGAALGASRAAVDAGFAAPDLQVGQTGKSVAPDLYLAIGISGAVQHLAGMKDSKIVVAINKDPEAPIFQFADYGLVADLFEVLPLLQNAIAALPSD